MATLTAHRHAPDRDGGSRRHQVGGDGARRGHRAIGTDCAPAFEVAANPATISALLRDADAATRARLATVLQARHGNAAVQRLLDAPGPPVQRWAVALPRATSDCARVVSYLDANSPYRTTSGWARTHVRFSWSGDPSYTTSDGTTTATVANPRVTMSVRVDMPQWSPTAPAMSSAWTAMTGTLRAHEAEHERIAGDWDARLTARLGALSVTVPNRSLAAFNAAVQAEWNTWLAEHQADQDAIDPFTAVLDCSAETGQTEEEAQPEAPGEAGSTTGGEQ